MSNMYNSSLLCTKISDPSTKYWSAAKPLEPLFIGKSAGEADSIQRNKLCFDLRIQTRNNFAQKSAGGQMTNIAINGFGRIGRLGLRAMLERHKEELNVVAVNDMADLHTNVHLFRYDSTYGIFPGTVQIGEGQLKMDGGDIAVLSEKDPS